MMNTTGSCIPPGFRFHPTDEELIGYYLRKKVASQKIDLDVITDIDLYGIEPWDLIERCRIGYEEQKEWYFFSHKDKKYPTGKRTNRATMTGFWKATGRDKAVYDKFIIIGMRKTLVFYKGRAPNGQKSDWIMHEYRLESDLNAPPQEEGWVVCRAFRKRTTCQRKNNEELESISFHHKTTNVSSTVDSLDYVTKHPSSFLNHSIMRQQGLGAENLTCSKSDKFVQLPELASTSFPSTKRLASAVSLVHESNEEETQTTRSKDDSRTSTKVATGWRALDIFVASQLSHEEKNEEADNENTGIPAFSTHENYSDMALLLLESDYIENGCKLNELLKSDCGIGICMLDK